MAFEQNDKKAVQCAFCNKLGHVLDCCRDFTRNCLTCDELTQITIRDNERHQVELATLRDRIAQLEHDDPASRHAQLRDEKNAQIVALKADIEDVQKEEKQACKSTQSAEQKLRKLEAELLELQPKKEDRPPEFFMKNAKPKKGKKKVN
ncbi:hypothetical protein DE146DRAFT_792692 [Phaeosphaeria sp. MPI-PUGE-AT-0046c]|nr:hypothetical protein DE146DRAFT_792692 [Phaeosphaeria sp. MPI-PUGE-AT-0046c]